MRAVSFVFGVVDGCQCLHLSFGVVGDHHLDGVEDSTDADSSGIQVVTYGTFQQRHIVQGVDLRVADLVDEVHDTLRTVATTTESADGRHTGIVPAAYHTVLYQCQQIALRHQRIVQVQLVELRLTGTVVLDVVRFALPFLHPGNEEVIEGSVLDKLQGTP